VEHSTDRMLNVERQPEPSCGGGLRPWRVVECHTISVGRYQGAGALLLLRLPAAAETATERQVGGRLQEHSDQEMLNLAQEGGGGTYSDDGPPLGLELALRLDGLPDQVPIPEPEPEAAPGGVQSESLLDDCTPISLKGAVTAAELRVVEGTDCRVLGLRLTLELNRSLCSHGSRVGPGRRVFADATLSGAAESFETALEVARREGAHCGISGHCLPKWTEYVPQRWYCRELRLAVSGGTVLYAASSMLWACWQLCVLLP
jgi:hypothetical protein